MSVDALGQARTVVSVGAGTGSYEPANCVMVAGEPWAVTTRPTSAGCRVWIQAVAESLALRSESFDAALAVSTIRYWSDPWAGLTGMRRMARRQIVLTFDPVRLQRALAH